MSDFVARVFGSSLLVKNTNKGGKIKSARRELVGEEHQQGRKTREEKNAK